MVGSVLHVAGFYLTLIGTWRLANATTHAPIGPEMYTYSEGEKGYNPLLDLISPHEVLFWIIRTIMSFNKPGWFGNAIILQKRFNWALLWLLLGICFQFLAAFI